MIRIGIIGMSPGNAHPYSWSAIINGHFDGEEISRVGYPAVSAYLRANQDTLGMPAAKVTHVWTQDRAISQSIAVATRIPHVVDNMEDMIGQVDAVILARDDPENHREMSRPFIEAGVPVFIDKPLAFSGDDLKWFSDQVQKGKFIMSCSSMRYANECRILRQDINSLGKIQLVTAVGKKDWKKYGIHLLEAIFALLDDPKPVSVLHAGYTDKDIVVLEFENGLMVTVHLFQEIVGTFQVSVFGENGWRLADIKNSYSMFRDNIIEFVRSVEEGAPRLSFDKTQRLIQTLIAAEESRLLGGAKVDIGTY